MLRAVAPGSAGEAEQAAASLERAVRLAEPEGYVQVFADVPSPPVGLLQSLARRHRTWTFVRHLAAVTSPPGRPAATTPRCGGDGPATAAARPAGRGRR